MTENTKTEETRKSIFVGETDNKNNANRKCKDTVFTSLFGSEDKKYLLELYQALHPEDKSVSADDLELVTIENIFTNGIYNDLGFKVRGKLIVLVEAQSTWSVNIVVRMFLYLATTYRNYIFSNENLKLKIYTNKKIDIPKPEMYVIYTGDEEVKSRVISLKDEFFNGEDVGIDVKVKVILDKNRKNDIILQYIMFCKVLNEQFRLHGITKEAVKEVIRICKECGYLKKYLSQHELEVTDMLFGSKEEIERGYREMIKEESFNSGLEKGLEQGFEQGKLETKLEVYKTCIDRGMSREDALIISELPADMIPED